MNDEKKTLSRGANSAASGHLVLLLHLYHPLSAFMLSRKLQLHRWIGTFGPMASMVGWYQWCAFFMVEMRDYRCCFFGFADFLKLLCDLFHYLFRRVKRSLFLTLQSCFY